MTRAFAVVLAASISSSAYAAGVNYIFVQNPVCKFRYDERLETRVLSILQRELTSEGAAFYDAKNPIVTLCRKKATLMLSVDTAQNGKRFLDPPHVFVDVDVCSHQILGVDRDDGITVTDASPCE